MTGTAMARAVKAARASLAISLVCLAASCRDETPEGSAPPKPEVDAQGTFRCFECGENFTTSVDPTQNETIHRNAYPLDSERHHI